MRVWTYLDVKLTLIRMVFMDGKSLIEIIKYIKNRTKRKHRSPNDKE